MGPSRDVLTSTSSCLVALSSPVMINSGRLIGILIIQRLGHYAIYYIVNRLKGLLRNKFFGRIVIVGCPSYTTYLVYCLIDYVS